MTDFSDLDTLSGGKSYGLTTDQIRKGAHVVNGGDATFSCPSCKGRGRFISYAGRDCGPCFKCKGEGKVGSKQIAAHKGQQTKKLNDHQFRIDNATTIAWAHQSFNNGFRVMGKMLDKLNKDGRWTAADLAYVQKFEQQDADRKALREVQIAEEKAKIVADAPAIELSAIDKLFVTAVENEIKRPIFRSEHLDIAKAPMTGRNAGALYVTRRDENSTFLGMLKDGKFIARREATQEDHDALFAVAADPTDAAIKYARKTGKCGCCARDLVNPVSILAGIGPICASKWGLDFKRDLAETEYAAMKAEEIKRIKE